jgi:phthiocerol/phenolphthiocerol synthesis type-I polyketide synthase C
LLAAERTREAIPGPSFYGRLAEHGLQSDPGVQTVQEIWRRDGEATARLTPIAGSSTVDAGDFDAALLDACFQVLTAALPAGNGDSHDTYLPVGLSELRIHGLPADGSAWCHAVLRTGLDPEACIPSGFHSVIEMRCEPQSRETMSRGTESGL